MSLLPLYHINQLHAQDVLLEMHQNAKLQSSHCIDSSVSDKTEEFNNDVLLMKY